MSDQIEVIVVDDYPLFRTGIIQTLNADENITVVGEGSSAEDAIQLSSRHAPNIALLDISMPGGGIEAAKRLLKLTSPTKVIFLTELEAEDNVLAAIDAGAVGYLLKGTSATDLVSAIKIVAAGGSFMSPIIGFRVVAHLRRPSVADVLSSLSPQEERTLRLVANGLSNRQIGDILGIVEKSVKSHMTNAMAKLGVQNRVAATIVARQGWGESMVNNEVEVNSNHGGTKRVVRLSEQP
jgi:DNA-binding NarL/FixJ family response regulator